MTQMDFGLAIAARDISTQELLSYNDTCIRALSPHFTTLWIEDHFQWKDTPALECLTSLSFLAARYQRLMLGSLVLCQSYRNPALVAKMAANIQFLSQGRFILGLGAGWYEEEHTAYGYPFPSLQIRMSQLEEAILITKAMWGAKPASFQGLYYQVHEAACLPQPSPTIPLLIGGGGERQTLSLVARYADWWNLHNCALETYAEKVAVLREHCHLVGRDIGEIRQSYLAGTIQISKQTSPSPLPSHKIGGTPEMVRKKLETFSALGVTHMIVKFSSIEALQLFTEEVAPYFTSF